MASKYSKYKIFHFKDKIDSLPREVDEILPPINIRIKPTNVCLHNCWYCSYRLEGVQLGQDMVEKDYIPKEKMFEIIDDCEKMGVKAITFSGGGDPFYYKYLLETVQKLSQTSIKFSSLTNGVMLKGEVAKIFAQYGTWIRISIDGWDDKSYAEYRSIKEGEFSKVIENMKNFKKLGGKCALGVSLVVDAKNYTHVYEIIKKVHNVGIDSIKISPCVVSNLGSENNKYHEPLYDTVQEELAKAKKDFENTEFEIFNSYHFSQNEFDKEYGWCPFLQILPVIGADLNVYPCHDKAYNLDDGLLGSIKERSLKDFWMNDKDKFFKINPSKVCNNRCVPDEKNKMLIDYLNVDMEHLDFL